MAVPNGNCGPTSDARKEDTMAAASGVIWCPGCDSVLNWRLNEDDEPELTSTALDHLKFEHNKVLDSPILKTPSPA